MKKAKKKSFLLLIIVTLFWYAQYIYVPYQSPYLISIHVSINMVGIIIGAYGISQLILRLPVGILADIKNQHKFFILLGTALSGLASSVRIINPNGIGFLIGNVISGFASATWISFMILFVSFFPSSQNDTATCRIVMANNLGMFLAFLSSTLLFNSFGMVFICLLSMISGFIAFILATKLHYPHRDLPATSPHLLLTVFSNKRLIFFAFLALVQQGIQMSTTMSFTNQIVIEIANNPFLIGLSSIIYMFSSVLFAQLGASRWRKKLSVEIWISLSFLLLAIYCFTLPLCHSIMAIFILQIIPGIATGILFSLLTAEAMKGVPKNSVSTALGLFQSIYAIGMTLFPMLVGYFSHRFSIRVAYFILAIIALSAFTSYLIHLHKQNRQTIQIKK